MVSYKKRKLKGRDQEVEKLCSGVGWWRSEGESEGEGAEGVIVVGGAEERSELMERSATQRTRRILGYNFKYATRPTR